MNRHRNLPVLKVRSPGYRRAFQRMDESLARANHLHSDRLALLEAMEERVEIARLRMALLCAMRNRL